MAPSGGWLPIHIGWDYVRTVHDAPPYYYR
jgi:hypothetical protein